MRLIPGQPSNQKAGHHGARQTAEMCVHLYLHLHTYALSRACFFGNNKGPQANLGLHGDLHVYTRSNCFRHASVRCRVSTALRNSLSKWRSQNEAVFVRGTGLVDLGVVARTQQTANFLTTQTKTETETPLEPLMTARNP